MLTMAQLANEKSLFIGKRIVTLNIKFYKSSIVLIEGKKFLSFLNI